LPTGKFARAFAEKYRMQPVRLNDEARSILVSFHWPKNIRQLKNIAEQISIIENDREENAEVLRNYLPLRGRNKSNL
jgi:DNA-binding NtrC family response regulator